MMYFLAGRDPPKAVFHANLQSFSVEDEWRRFVQQFYGLCLFIRFDLLDVLRCFFKSVLCRT